ncbi:hypothetical protein TUM17580_04580 [Citrobacter farmeri]|nr:hypothetical protein TUM17580_04580 [Citrobacter farmeri]
MEIDAFLRIPYMPCQQRSTQHKDEYSGRRDGFAGIDWKGNGKQRRNSVEKQKESQRKLVFFSA